MYRFNERKCHHTIFYVVSINLPMSWSIPVSQIIWNHDCEKILNISFWVPSRSFFDDNGIESLQWIARLNRYPASLRKLSLYHGDDIGEFLNDPIVCLKTGIFSLNTVLAIIKVVYIWMVRPSGGRSRDSRLEWDRKEKIRRALHHILKIYMIYPRSQESGEVYS